MDRPVLVCHHVRSGIAALNVVSAALDADPRTARLEVRFSRGVDETASHVRELGARAIVAWSFYSTDFARAAEDLVAVRRRVDGRDAIHVAGGVHATAEAREVLDAGFDLAAIGEGETTIVAIVDAIARGCDPRAISGTAHLVDGALVSHGPGERRPLDEFPACNLRYGKWNALEITRGCIYACTFCQTPFMFKARFRHRGIENVVAHVRAMRAGGLRYVRFVTATSLSYGSDDERPNLAAVDALLAAVREAIGAEGKIYFGTFPSEVRPEHVTPEALAILARWVDNRSLVIGGQCGSDRLLAEMRRGHDVDAVERAVSHAVAAGFRPDVDFIVGMPGETPADRAASLGLAERLVARGARIHSHSFLPLPGTPLRERHPEAIEPEVARALSRLESRGAMYGHWRKQIVLAKDLVRRRAR